MVVGRRLGAHLTDLQHPWRRIGNRNIHCTANIAGEHAKVTWLVGRRKATEVPHTVRLRNGDPKFWSGPTPLQTPYDPRSVSGTTGRSKLRTRRRYGFATLGGVRFGPASFRCRRPRIPQFGPPRRWQVHRQWPQTRRPAYLSTALLRPVRAGNPEHDLRCTTRQTFPFKQITACSNSLVCSSTLIGPFATAMHTKLAWQVARRRRAFAPVAAPSHLATGRTTRGWLGAFATPLHNPTAYRAPCTTCAPLSRQMCHRTGSTPQARRWM